MHLMSTERERRFFEHAEYPTAENASVKGRGFVFVKPDLSYKPEWNRDFIEPPPSQVILWRRFFCTCF